MPRYINSSGLDSEPSPHQASWFNSEPQL